MEFYKLFHQRTNYKEMLKDILMSIYPEYYKAKEQKAHEALMKFYMAGSIIRGIGTDTYL